MYKKDDRKVGIVTYYSFYNYGSSWQAYALANTINELGYEARLVDFADYNQEWNKRLRKKVLFHRFVAMLHHPTTIKKTLETKSIGNKVVKLRDKEIQEKFETFLHKALPLSDDDFTSKKSGYMAFVCGSDQVWQLDPPGLHYIFFLRFCEAKKRISYAASFGTTTIPDYNKSYLKKYLEGFSAISVREDVGVQIVNNATNKIVAKQVLDPVLLKPTEWWNDKAKRINTPEKYIVCYFLGKPGEYESIIREKAANEKASIIWISTGFESAQAEDIVLKPTPEQFLWLIKESFYVFTDSLHGTEFALTYKKQFSICKRQYLTGPEQQSRLDSLIRLLRLDNQLLTIDNSICYDWPEVDYENIEQILMGERLCSLEYLNDALKNTCDVKKGY